jgi:hypothetical protein
MKLLKIWNIGEIGKHAKEEDDEKEALRVS